MPKFNIVVEHNLSQEQALERIQKLLGEVKNQFADQISDLQESWIGNTGKFSFSTMGFSVSGIITVHFSYVELSGKLPFTGAVFKKKIEKVILERAKTLFA